MNKEEILAAITGLSTILLIVSELLGISKCDANSIIEIYKIFSKAGCVSRGEDAGTQTSPIIHRQEEEEEEEEEEEVDVYIKT